jgi:uncharacterized cupredoxin-like copper-binding protein
MKIQNKMNTLLGFVLLTLALASCSGSPSVNVTLTTYKIQVSSDSVAAGNVTFHVKNAATDMTHEMVVVKTDLDAAKLPLDSNGNVDESKLTEVGAVKNLAAGASQDLTVDLQSGHYVLLCNLNGHYAAGMYTNFTAK